MLESLKGISGEGWRVSSSCTAFTTPHAASWARGHVLANDLRAFHYSNFRRSKVGTGPPGSPSTASYPGTSARRSRGLRWDCPSLSSQSLSLSLTFSVLAPRGCAGTAPTARWAFTATTATRRGAPAPAGPNAPPDQPAPRAGLPGSAGTDARPGGPNAGQRSRRTTFFT